MLGQRFGVRPTVIAGAVIATIGISCCYFTTSLKVITLLFGGIFGIGYGFISTLMPVILNAYFLNLRATANGLANSGSCIGSVILPIVFEHLISSYGLPGCFLLTGGIVLHLTIAGALMRPPPWMKFQEMNNDGQDVAVEYKSLQRDHYSDITTVVLSKKVHKNDLSKVYCEEDTKNSNALTDNEDSLIDQQDGMSPKHVPHLINSKIFNDFERNTNISDRLSSVDSHKRGHKTLPPRILESFFSVLTCPMFYITAATNVSFYFLYHMYVVIIVDYALDRQVADVDTKNILFAFGISDLFGRLCLGWITDRKFVSRSRFVMLCMFLIGITFFAFPYADRYSTLITVSCLYGLLLGCTMIVFPILLVDFCGIELHAVAYGCMCFLNGFASFGRPFLIGYFRDNIGSYSSIFYILGSLSIASSTLWLLEKCCRKKQIEQSEQFV